MGGADQSYSSLIYVQQSFGLLVIHLVLLKTMKETFVVNTSIKEL